MNYQPSLLSEDNEPQNYYELYIGIGFAHKEAPNSKFRNSINCLEKTKTKNILLVDGPNMSQDTGDMGNSLGTLAGSVEPESKSLDVFAPSSPNDSSEGSLEIDEKFEDAVENMEDMSFENETVEDSQPTNSKQDEEIKEEDPVLNKNEVKYEDEEDEDELGLRSMNFTFSTESSQSSIPAVKKAKIENDKIAELEFFENKIFDIKPDKFEDGEIVEEKSLSIVNESAQSPATSSQKSTSQLVSGTQNSSPIENVNLELSEELQELLAEFSATKTCFEPNLDDLQPSDWIAGSTEYSKRLFPTEVRQKWFCCRSSSDEDENIKPELCPDIQRLFDCYEAHSNDGYHAFETLIHDISAIDLKKRKPLYSLYRYFIEQSKLGKAKETLELFHFIVFKLSEKSDSLPSKIPRLVANYSGSVTLTRNQCSIILANMFLGICPEYCSFYYILAMKHSIGLEKVKFIMTYFETVQNSPENGNVTFRRTKLPQKLSADLKSDTSKIKDLEFHISTDLKIEHAAGCSQMDFANKYIGGGVLGEGSVQEEIRFLMCPEMIVSMLLCESMRDYESIRIIGAKTYSSYEGYGYSLRWKPLQTIDADLNNMQDNHGRYINELIAVDAIDYSRRMNGQQFTISQIDREINKLLVGFTAPRNCSKNPPITTGWWGCGAFRGDKKLKALLQILAATIAKRPLIFCTFGEPQLARSLYNIFKKLKSSNCTAGRLYQILISYKTSPYFLRASLFDHVSRELNPK